MTDATRPRADEPEAGGTALTRWSEDTDTRLATGRLLSPKFDLLLRHGDTQGDYRSGSEAIRALLVHMLNRRVPEPLARSMILDPRNRGGVSSLARRRRDLDKWWQDEWRRASVFVQQRPAFGDRKDVVLRVAELLDAADGYEWHGVAGRTDRAVYEAELHEAMKAGKLSNLALPVRTVARRAGRGEASVSRSMERLRGDGFQRRTDRSGRSKGLADRWDLEPRNVRRNRNSPTHRTTLRVGCSDEFGTSTWRDCSKEFAHPLWFRRGLGPTKQAYYEALGGEAVTVADLAAAFGVGRRCAEKHIELLIEHGLARREDSTIVRGEASLDQVAEVLGVLGLDDEQRVRHETEREQFGRWRVARDAAEAAALRSGRHA